MDIGFSNEYIDPHSPVLVAWTRSDTASVVKDFWATVNGATL